MKDNRHYSGTFITAVCEERARQLAKFPDQDYSPSYLMAAVMQEEVGEFAKALLEKEPWQNVQAELVQIATVCYAMFQELQFEEELRKCQP